VDRQLTVGGLLRTWLPTAFGASVLVAEIPVVYAAAARSADGARALAALGICLAVLVVVNTPALSLTPLVAVESGRRGLRRYALAVGAAGALVLLLLGAVPPAAHVVGLVFGMDEALLRHVRDGLIALAPNALGVALRRELHGRLVHAGRTGPIVAATAVRIVGTGALAFVAVALWPERGALAGGLALSAGAFLEAALLAARAPAPAGTRPLEPLPLVRVHAHLSSTRLLAMAPMVITTVGIAHAHEARASLVVWPALYELLMLFTSPASDWEAVCARALRRRAASRAPRQVAGWLGAGFTLAFAAVVFSGAGEGYLRSFVGVPEGPTALAVAWMPVLLVVPALWVLRAHLHGILMAAGETAVFVRAGVGHALVLAGTVLALGALPGVGAACLAVVAGLLADVAVTRSGQVGSSRAGYHPNSRTRRKEPVVAPQTDVVDALTTDHREALDLLDRIARSTHPSEKRDLADTVIAEVVRHAIAEEMYVYPAMREHLPEGEKEVQHDVEEHKQLEETMKQLEAVDATEPRFDGLVRRMTDQLRHHAHDEESEQFPQLRAQVPHERLVEMREKVETAKKLAPTRPHPNAPHTELFHKLVGPGVGLVDRLRDRLTHRGS
jgi:hemerythrin superfamily protein